MELIAVTRNGAAAYAYGASLTQDGTRLRCELLLVLRGNARRTLTLRCPATKERIRVQLPPESIGSKGHCRFSFETLEVLPS